MANAELIAPLPIIDLYGGATVVLEALDAVTGAVVTGVLVSNVTIYGEALESSGPDDLGTLRVFLQPPSGVGAN